MGFDLPVFIAAGVQDALSPTQFAIAGIYALMMLFLRQSRKSAVLVPAGLFIGVLLVLGVMMDLRFLGPAAASPGPLKNFSWVFPALGTVFAALGLLFLREWRILVSGRWRKFAAFIPTPEVGKPAGFALSFFLAAGLAFLSNIWPVNYQVLIQSEMAFSPGSFFYSLGALLIYEFCRNGPVLFVLLFFVLARRKNNIELLRRKRSLVSIIVSAFCFAVGVSLFFFFFVAATKPWF